MWNIVPDPPPGPAAVPVTGSAGEHARQLLSASSDAAAVAWFQAKQIQPLWKQIVFSAGTGSEIESQFFGNFTPRSLLLVNPTSLVVYIGTGGNPLSSGLPVAAESVSARVPILAQNLIVAIDPSQADLATTEYQVHLFLYPTPD